MWINNTRLLVLVRICVSHSRDSLCLADIVNNTVHNLCEVGLQSSLVTCKAFSVTIRNYSINIEQSSL